MSIIYFKNMLVPVSVFIPQNSVSVRRLVCFIEHFYHFKIKNFKTRTSSTLQSSAMEKIIWVKNLSEKNKLEKYIPHFTACIIS